MDSFEEGVVRNYVGTFLLFLPRAKRIYNEQKIRKIINM